MTCSCVPHGQSTGGAAHAPPSADGATRSIPRWLLPCVGSLFLLLAMLPRPVLAVASSWGAVTSESEAATLRSPLSLRLEHHLLAFETGVTATPPFPDITLPARPSSMPDAPSAVDEETRLYLPLLAFNSSPLLDTSHAGRYDTYAGSATCRECHAAQTTEMHSALHYQWFGPTPDVPEMDGGGKLGGINDFCGYPDTNFIGLLTNLDGEQVDGGCATCHVGLGAKPTVEATDAQLDNIDCLICHSPTYARKVAATGSSFQFVPAPEKMTVSLLEAITDIGLPTDANCLACHAYAGGGNNNKRGDLEAAHANPPDAHFDVHMADPAQGGAGLSCLDCHVSQEHRIAGRGTDLRATDLDVAVTCTNCHADRPHADRELDRHTARIDCATCHVRDFAKVQSTEMFRDYRAAAVDEAKRLYEPVLTRAANVIPDYLFDNGTSAFYEFGDPYTLGPRERVVMSTPLGSIQDPDAKIYPFKHHTAMQPFDRSTNAIIPLKLGMLFQTGDPDASIRAGATALGWPLDQGYDFIGTERFMGIYHEVGPAEDALGCNECHRPNANRLDFAALGYAPRVERNGKPLCLSCHGHEDDEDEWGANEYFYELHDEHVGEEGVTCLECHTFAQAR